MNDLTKFKKKEKDLPPMSWEEYSKKEPLITAVERIAREEIHKRQKK